MQTTWTRMRFYRWLKNVSARNISGGGIGLPHLAQDSPVFFRNGSSLRSWMFACIKVLPPDQDDAGGQVQHMLAADAKFSQFQDVLPFPFSQHYSSR